MFDASQMLDDLEDGADGAVSSGRGRATTQPRLPPGAWPYLLTAPYAAALVSEPSVESFLRKCGDGRPYPKGRRADGGGLKWLRSDLEKAAARLFGDEGAGDLADLFR